MKEQSLTPTLCRPNARSEALLSLSGTLLYGLAVQSMQHDEIPRRICMVVVGRASRLPYLWGELMQGIVESTRSRFRA